CKVALSIQGRTMFEKKLSGSQEFTAVVEYVQVGSILGKEGDYVLLGCRSLGSVPSSAVVEYVQSEKKAITFCWAVVVWVFRRRPKKKLSGHHPFHHLRRCRIRIPSNSLFSYTLLVLHLDFPILASWVFRRRPKKKLSGSLRCVRLQEFTLECKVALSIQGRTMFEKVQFLIMSFYLT
ncbi:hypothetical protein L9F63_006462, partial [Diploptera punctata]